ncbi:MAG: hypothetical protein ABSA17_06205 [Rhabdochlamydiaceae bacterium]
MLPSSPVCEKIGSFFTYGGVSGDKLEKVKERKVSVVHSFDKQPGSFLALNCVSKVHAIKLSLYQQPANSCLSVASEENEEDPQGTIYEVIQRRKSDIERYEEGARASGFDRVSIKCAALRNIICEDEIFISKLREKTHKTALFIFDVTPEKDEISALGCKEVRRQGITPDKIVCVLIPERYRSEIMEKGAVHGIPLDKVRFIRDKDEAIAFGYKDSHDTHPWCKIAKPISVPDYESEVRIVAEKFGGIDSHPLFLHMTRLPE